MKRVILFLVLLTLFAYPVLAGARTISGFTIAPTCEADGSAKILVENKLDRDLETSKLKFRYHYSETRFSDSGTLEGSFEESVILEKGEAYFRMPEGTLQYKGTYNFIMEEEDCDRLSCMTQYEVECLGALRKTVCEAKESFDIKSCGLQDGLFHAVITNIGAGLLDELALADLSYNFYGESTSYSSLANNLPTDAKLTYLGGEEYEITFSPRGRIKRAEISNHVCGGTAFETCVDTVTVVEEIEEVKDTTPPPPPAPEIAVPKNIPEPATDDATAKIVIVIFLLALVIFVAVKIVYLVRKE